MPHVSDSVVDDAEYQDDYVLLNGQQLLVRSPIRAGMISEFATGLKIGKATYDEREHAFWAVLDDFSGGLGFRQQDIREAGGTHWDNVGGVDLRRPRHITLPPIRTTVSPDLDPGSAALTDHYHTMLVSDVGGTEFLHIGILDSLFTLSSDRATLTRRYQQVGTSMRFGRVLEAATSTGTRFLMACGSVGTGTHEYVRSTNGTTWTASSALPATPAANASMQISDMMLWDGMIIAHGEGDQIFGGVDGIAWLENDAGALDWHWRTGDVEVHWLGVAMAPWGAAALYFISRGKLWVLDWYVHNVIEIQDIGENNWLERGAVWDGSIFVTDGQSVWEYNPGNAQTVRRVGLFGKDGPTPSWTDAAETHRYSVHDFIPGTSDLYVVCRNLTTPRSWRLAVYNGIGWSWLGPEVASSQPYSQLVDRFPISVSLTRGTRFIDIAALNNQLGTDFTLHLYELPQSGDIPTYGMNQDFEDGPLAFETGWFDGGFSELQGALIRLAYDGYHMSTSETVQVEYRLNNNEDATYINLGTFTLNQQEIWFSTDHQGIPFKTVQFRVTLDRGATTNRTPEMRALILLFDKKPEVRTSWTIQVDVARMVDRQIQIDGETATTERVWQFLKRLANYPTLLRLVVPSLESGGVNVRITDMPATIQDFRPARGGRGVVDLQLIEPASE